MSTSEQAPMVAISLVGGIVDGSNGKVREGAEIALSQIYLSFTPVGWPSGSRTALSRNAHREEDGLPVYECIGFVDEIDPESDLSGYPVAEPIDIMQLLIDYVESQNG